jgi:GT2 family glycosyltransferase
VDALRAHAPGAELVVLEAAGGDFRPGRDWNRLLQLTRADYLVLADGRSRVGPGWLPRLLDALRGDVVAAVPLQRDEAGRPTHAALAAAPDADDAAPRPLLGPTGGLVMLDAVRCRELLFDERYRRDFADLDFGLRAWEAGLRIVCAPRSLATRLSGADDAASPSPPHELFEEDRRLFAETWAAGGRPRRLPAALDGALRELRRLLELGPEAVRLLHRGREAMGAYRMRAWRLFEELRLYPVLPEMLAAAASHLLGGVEPDVNDPKTGHLAWLLGLAGRPVAVEADRRGWRVSLCGGWYATPAAEGDFSLARRRRGGYSQVQEADDLDALQRRIDAARLRR